MAARWDFPEDRLDLDRWLAAPRPAGYRVDPDLLTGVLVFKVRREGREFFEQLSGEKRVCHVRPAVEFWCNLHRWELADRGWRRRVAGALRELRRSVRARRVGQ